MTSTAIKVVDVGKAYKRYPSKWSRAWEWMSHTDQHQKTWILRHINFDVPKGEAVGIVGINGAGKSTLLKIIAGTTHATEGRVEVAGRVAALLELGMGFHPNFTGRQNVAITAQLLGVRKDEIAAHMPAIEAFAEIGDYIDRPVRTYSSGMRVRLAFSVATAVRPQVLIVDEALSVGDAYFRHKSFNRIREFRKQGTSLLIVSHDRNAIQSLCDRALLLDGGFVIKDGPPEEVMDFYNALIAEKKNATVHVNRLADGRAQTVSGTGEAHVESIELRNEKGELAEYLNVGEQACLHVRIVVNTDLPELVFGYMIKDRLGQAVFGTNTHYLDVPLKQLRAGDRIGLSFTFRAAMGVGSYSVTTALHVDETHLAGNYEWRDLALIFNVVNMDRVRFTGVNWMPPTVECFR